jgi:hypothetical protein
MRNPTFRLEISMLQGRLRKMQIVLGEFRGTQQLLLVDNDSGPSPLREAKRAQTTGMQMRRLPFWHTAGTVTG